jgi:hypothetical protein
VPWLKKRQWASGRIRDQSTKFAVASTIFTIVFGALTGLVINGILSDPKHDPALWVMPIVLGVPALAMLVWTIRQIMVRVKFGRSVFELETIPGAIGGWLAGNIRTPVILDVRQVRIELECVGRYTVDSFGKVTASEHRIFHRQQALSGALPRQDNCTCIPVAFEIPADAPASGRKGWDHILWRLHARAGQRGADYDATFIVPVFVVPDQSTAAPKAEAIAAPLRNRSRNNHVRTSADE